MGSKGVRKGARLDTHTVVAHTARFVVVVAIIVFVAILIKQATIFSIFTSF